MQQAGLEPRTSISRVQGVNCSATHTTHVATQKYVGNINFCTADPDPSIFVLFPPCSLLDTLDTAEARLTNCQGIGEICSLYRTTPFTVKPGQA